MKRILIILAIVVNCTLLIDNCMSQWVQQSVPVTAGFFFDMKFVNANTGFISNSTSKLLKTTNAGYNWQLNKELLMLALSTVDSMYIYGAGMTLGYGRLYKSTNCGVSWDSLLISGSYTYHYLHFFNRDTGLISGSNSSSNLIWRTTDGGQTVQLVQTINVSSVGKFFFLKEKINGEYYGWMYYPGSSFLMNTTNSGLTWNSLPSFSGNLNSIFFVNQDTGWATTTSYTNYIYMTTNGGVNWVGKYNDLNIIYYEIYFANSQKGWVSGPSFNVCVTTNGGNNWGTQNIQGDYSSKLFFLDSLNGWIKTSSTTVAHTTNGGGTITSIISGSTETQKDYRLYQNYPNPFNPITNVKFSILNAGNVKIVVYDVQGREVQTLVNETLKPGTYEATFDGSALNSGIYFYQLIAEGIAVQTRKMILLK